MSNVYKLAMEKIQKADAVLVSASNGLSIAEGFHIFADNEDFQKNFGEFRAQYGVNCLIRGVFTPMTANDHARYMQIVHRYLIEDYRGSHVMQNLQKILSGKDFFIVTSNADTHFQLSGFPAQKIFEVEGNFDGLEEGSDAWNLQRETFEKFLSRYGNSRVVQLELGIGSRNRLIKAPLMQMVAEHPLWQFITLNLPQEIFIPESIQSKSLAVPGGIGESFVKMLECHESQMI